MKNIEDISTHLIEKDEKLLADIKDIDDISIKLKDNKTEEIFTSSLNEEVELFANVEDNTPIISSSLAEDIALLPGGESDYNFLKNKPKINGITLEGDHDAKYYGLGCYYSDSEGSDALGGIAQGEKFNNVPVIDLLYKLLHKYQQPIISIGLNPTTVLYNCVADKIEKLKITANVTKRTNDIQWVKIYFNNELWETMIGEDVKDGGSFSVDRTFETPITGFSGKQYKARVECYDGKKTVASEATITFVGISYVGVLEENIEITVDAIKTLDTKLKNTKDLEYTFNTEGTELYNICYTYPKHLGELSSIKDLLNFENIQEYNKTDIVIDNTDYICYAIKNPVSVADYKLVFK